jgi:hypothetical protein
MTFVPNNLKAILEPPSAKFDKCAPHLTIRLTYVKLPIHAPLYSTAKRRKTKVLRLNAMLSCKGYCNCMQMHLAYRKHRNAILYLV